MLLTAEQKAHMAQRLAQAQIRPSCPWCEHALDWAAIAELIAVPTYTEYVGGFREPVRIVRCICPHCAAITTFDAAALDMSMYHELGNLKAQK